MGCVCVCMWTVLTVDFIRRKVVITMAALYQHDIIISGKINI